MNGSNQLFLEIETHLITDAQPSKFLNNLFQDKDFGFPFQMLTKLKQIKQSPKHHPEGSVWIHTMMVVDQAAKIKHKSSDCRAFMWAALLHDIGKAETTRIKKEKITSYDHDKVGAKLAKNFLEECTSDTAFIQKVVSLIRWHMQILFVVNDLPFADINSMKQQTDVNEIALLGLCDRMGRLYANQLEEENNISVFLKKVN